MWSSSSEQAILTRAALRSIADSTEPLQEITTLYPGISISDSSPNQQVDARLE